MTISYVLLADSVVNVSASLGERFALHWHVNAGEAFHDIRVRLNGETVSPTEVGTAAGDRYTLGGIAAKEMTVPVAYEVVGRYKTLEKDIVLSRGTTCLAKVLASYLTSREVSEQARVLAYAAVLYGSEAQSHFRYRYDNPATDYLPSEGLPALPAAVAESVLAYDKQAGDAAGFTALSLLLADALSLKVYVHAAAREGLTLQVARDAAFTGAAVLPLTAEGDLLSAACPIEMGAYGDALYLRVMQGETAVSATLTYSVQSYIYRHRESESESLYYLLRALLVMGAAADAYLA